MRLRYLWDSRKCRCGHPRAAHRHYRRGTDCASCLGCGQFRGSVGPGQYFAALLRRL